MRLGAQARAAAAAADWPVAQRGRGSTPSVSAASHDDGPPGAFHRSLLERMRDPAAREESRKSSMRRRGRHGRKRGIRIRDSAASGQRAPISHINRPMGPASHERARQSAFREDERSRQRDRGGRHAPVAGRDQRRGGARRRAAGRRALRPVDGALSAAHGRHRFLIRIYNNDGSEAGACGNGMRCVAVADRQGDRQGHG